MVIPQDIAENIEFLQQIAKKHNRNNKISFLKSKISSLRNTIDYWKNKFDKLISFLHSELHNWYDKDDKYIDVVNDMYEDNVLDDDIKDLKLIGDIKYENNKTIFSIYCKVSKGTYIRSLINDLALKLNTLGIMTNLQRTKQGIFSIEDSYTLDQINNDNFKMISIEDAINDCEKIVVDEKLEFKIKNGVKMPNIYNQDKVLFLNSIGKAIALYKISSKDIEVLEVLKMF